VNRIITDLAVVDITEAGFKLVERAPGVSIEEIRLATQGNLVVEGEIPEMDF
jgi:acyl CoA:acetate/3-ketoacid CoA transferase beta subunit